MSVYICVWYQNGIPSYAIRSKLTACKEEIGLGSPLLERETITGISRLADSLDTGMARVSKLKPVVKAPSKRHASYPSFDLNRPDNAEDDSISSYPPLWSLSLHHDMLQMLLTDPAFPVSMQQRHRHLWYSATDG
ncbi:hypothetical protein H106_00857 [Trichophyton rubrum CBS 735.88]|nr:hypothetical protein H106_00857 [Trichophyton rubrum CBS 735.88]